MNLTLYLTCSGISVSMTLTVGKSRRDVCILTLKPGGFEDAIIPENVEAMWGPIQLPSLPTDVPNKCIVASHSLFNHVDKLKFTCRVIHSLPLNMSVVQVYYADKLVSVAHLVGGGTLTRPDQVERYDRIKNIMLDSKKGERAMLIKDNNGDWGMCVGGWEGVTKGVPGIPGVKGGYTKPFAISHNIHNKIWKKDSINGLLKKELGRTTKKRQYLNRILVAIATALKWVT